MQNNTTAQIFDCTTEHKPNPREIKPKHMRALPSWMEIIIKLIEQENAKEFAKLMNNCASLKIAKSM